MKESNLIQVSWRAACVAGWKVSTHYFVLVVAAVFASFCVRVFYIYMAWRGLTWREVAMSYAELLRKATLNPIDGSISLPQFGELFGVLGLTSALIIFGAFLFAGLLGLIRDIYVTDDFHAGCLLLRSRENFWPILSYKIPIYIAGSLCAVPGLVIFELVILPTYRSLWLVAILAVIYGILLLYGRILLSIGPKRIVVHGRAGFIQIVSEITDLCRAHINAVVGFFSVNIALGIALIILPYTLICLQFPPILVQIVVLFACGWGAIFAKAAGIHFYIQLCRSQGSIQPSL